MACITVRQNVHLLKGSMDRCCSDNDDVPRARESLVHAYLQGSSKKMLHLRTQVDVQLENSKNVVTVHVFETRATIRRKLRFVKGTNETVLMFVSLKYKCSTVFGILLQPNAPVHRLPSRKYVSGSLFIAPRVHSGEDIIVKLSS